ncbi:MAG: hypothetical protein K2L05_05925 [Muribaculaceae bacterium]|nr:hypothetical protein [Muribaculaceae bacterium]
MRRLSAIILIMWALGASAGGFLKSLPKVSATLAGYESPDSVAERLSTLPLCPAEGLWQMTDGGALFAIERNSPSTDLAPAQMRMVMVRSPWRTIRPGTVIGHLQPTPKPGVYEARLYTDFALRTGLSIPRGFTLTLNSDASIMTIEPFKFFLKVNVFKLLPYMYRRVIEPQQTRPSGLTGAVKVAPAVDGHPLSPVYL